MRALFVGEGPHDVGQSPPYPMEPYPAGGVVTHLARKIVPTIDASSLAMRWTEVVRFRVEPEKGAGPRLRGLEAKAKAAVLIARVRCGCEGVVLSADQDGKDDENRLEKLRGARLGAFPIACGVAVQSIEAWTLGASQAIADELGVPSAQVREELRAAAQGRHVEDLARSGPTPPKDVLDRIATLGHRAADTAFREAVARRTDTSALERACPRGFAPFAAELRSAFERPPA